MPIFTLSRDWEHAGRRYKAGQVEASDPVYMAARAAGVIGQPTTATPSDAETQTERTVPRRERAKTDREG
jgi:hypothetical protein